MRVTLAPEGRRLLRVEARNAEVPIERKPGWIKTRAVMGPEYSAMKKRVHGKGPVSYTHLTLPTILLV